MDGKTVLCCVSGRTNITLDRPAYQSSLHKTYFAKRAVDGNRNGDLYNGSCTVTVSSSNCLTWWAVDLGTAQLVTEVLISNRIDRFSKLSLNTSNWFIQ